MFMVGLFGEYSDLAYARIRAMYRVNLTECVVLMLDARDLQGNAVGSSSGLTLAPNRRVNPIIFIVGSG